MVFQPLREYGMSSGQRKLLMVRAKIGFGERIRCCFSAQRGRVSRTSLGSLVYRARCSRYGDGWLADAIGKLCPDHLTDFNRDHTIALLPERKELGRHLSFNVGTYPLSQILR